MTISYNAVVELDRSARGVPDDTVDLLLDDLAGYAAVVGSSPRGRLEVTITLPAEDLRQAASSALAVVGAAATRLDTVALAAQVLPTTEFDARHGMEPLPELIGAGEAADILGLSRQRVAQLVAAGSLQGTQPARDLVLARAAVEAFAARDRGPGRPRSLR